MPIPSGSDQPFARRGTPRLRRVWSPFTAILFHYLYAATYIVAAKRQKVRCLSAPAPASSFETGQITLHIDVVGIAPRLLPKCGQVLGHIVGFPVGFAPTDDADMEVE